MATGMVVAGVMSGTSADGVDVALCRISAGGDGVPRVKVLGHRGFAYPKPVRGAVLRVMEGGAATAAEISRLNWRLGEMYAECVEKACGEFGVAVGGGEHLSRDEAAAKTGHSCFGVGSERGGCGRGRSPP